MFNLLAALPAPLTIQYSSSDIISQYLAEELLHFNKLLQYNYCSLKWLATLLRGDCDVIDKEQSQLLHDIVSNKVPSCWPNPLPVNMDLTSYIDLVKRKAIFYQQWPSTNICTIDLALSSQLPALLDTMMVQYCNDNGLQAEETCLSCQVSYHPTQVTLPHLSLQLLSSNNDTTPEDGIILTAPQLSLLTNQSTTIPLAAIKLTGTRCSDEYIRCPLMLAHGHNTVHITTLLLATPSHINPIQIVYKLF